MKSILVCCLMICGSACFGNEWVPYAHRLPNVPVSNTQLPMIQQYPVAPVYVVIPLMVPYIPVVTYESILVEQKQWCLFKRYEIINVPRINYVPARY